MMVYVLLQAKYDKTVAELLAIAPDSTHLRFRDLYFYFYENIRY